MSVVNDELVIVLEGHATAWRRLRAGGSDEQRLQPESLLRQLCAFITTYQLLHEGNRLAVLASMDHHVECLYSDLISLVDTSAAPRSQAAASEVASSFQRCLNAAADAGKPGSGCMSAALSRALCMVARTESNREADARRRLVPRLLVLQAAEDVPGQYIACMNAIFSAQRLGVLMDSVALAGQPAGFMEQASHITGGVHLRCQRPAALLQYLNMCFAVPASIRAWLELPKSMGVSLKATCFCHAHVVDVGFVCSVCLSVFCSVQPACSTCGTTF